MPRLFLVPNLCGCVWEIRDCPESLPFQALSLLSWAALQFRPQHPAFLSDPHPRGLISLCVANLDTISPGVPPPQACQSGALLEGQPHPDGPLSIFRPPGNET